jgi:Mg-chelatase subunit ChlD
MLIASLALHVSLAAGIVFSYFPGAARPILTSSEAITQPAPVMLLRNGGAPARQPQPPAPAMPVVQAMAATPPAVLPSPAQPVLKKSLLAPTVAKPAAVAVEANPNAHVAALPPEAVLSPSPAPQLNGADGVVFILDISGSMYEPCAGSTRLAFARETLSREIRALKDGRPFAVTLYAQNARTSGPLVAANNATREAAVRFIMHDVDCGGGTNLPAGLTAAQQLHAGSLVLVSDGDLNISASNLTSRALDILGDKRHSPALSIVGIAPRLETRDEQLLQALADQQGGSYRAEQPDRNGDLVTAASGSAKPISATP